MMWRRRGRPRISTAIRGFFNNKQVTATADVISTPDCYTGLSSTIDANAVGVSGAISAGEYLSGIIDPYGLSMNSKITPTLALDSKLCCC